MRFGCRCTKKNGNIIKLTICMSLILRLDYKIDFIFVSAIGHYYQKLQQVRLPIKSKTLWIQVHRESEITFDRPCNLFSVSYPIYCLFAYAFCSCWCCSFPKICWHWKQNHDTTHRCNRCVQYSARLSSRYECNQCVTHRLSCIGLGGSFWGKSLKGKTGLVLFCLS